MLKTIRLLLLLGIFGLILIGCKDNSKKDESTANNTLLKTEKQNDTYVTVDLDDGSTVEMKVKRQSGNARSPNILNVNMTDYSLLVILRLRSRNTPIEEKGYEDPDADITLKNVKKNGPIDEEYRSYYYKNENGQEGETKITVTYRGENHTEGTFTGTLYSKSHKKAIIRGKFNIQKKK